MRSATDARQLPFLFRATSINTFSMGVADQIMNGSVVLSSSWPPYDPPDELTWNEDPYTNKSWRLYFHALTTVSHLLDAYDRTDDLTYVVKARLLTESWLDAKGVPRSSRADYAWNEHSVASRTLTMLALRLRWQQSVLQDTAFEQRLLGAIHAHAIWLADPAEYRHANHGILQDRALMAVAVLIPEFSESSRWLATARVRLVQRCQADVAPSGVHLEHSPFYHLFFMRLFYSIRDFLDAHGIEDNQFDRILSKMEGYLVHVTRDDRTLPLIGDTRRGKIDPEFRVREIGDELRYVLSNGAEGRQPTVTDMAYADAGVAVMRDSWQSDCPVTLVFVSGFHSTVHKHADDLSFVLRVGSTDVLIDAGSHNNERMDPITTYQRSVFGHNAIAVDGRSYPSVKEQIGKATIDAFAVTDDGVRVQGSHRHFPGVTISREITYHKPDVFEIRDVIESDEEHEYTQIFNVGQSLETMKTELGFMLRDESAGIEVDVFPRGPVDEIRQYRGQHDPVLGWASEAYGKANPMDTIHVVSRGRTVELLTTVSIRIAGREQNEQRVLSAS